MATLNITEYKDLAVDSKGNVIPVGLEPSLRAHNLTYTTNAVSDALKKGTRYVRLTATAVCHIEFGSSPVAVASSTKLEANTPEYFGVSGIKELKIAAYDGTS